MKRDRLVNFQKDPYGLSFEKFGTYRDPYWWIFFPFNRLISSAAVFLVIVLFCCFADGPIGVGTWVALPISAIVVASLVRYVQLAVRDSKSGAPALSKQAFHWAIAAACEIFGGVIVALIWVSGGYS
ncbi:MAG: hypothetical protein FWF75_06860 [Propionibacteriaceae bacterium]|nr:hypothetical protein [Propionibacteriaceae bacterium]